MTIQRGDESAGPGNGPSRGLMGGGGGSLFGALSGLLGGFSNPFGKATMPGMTNFERMQMNQINRGTLQDARPGMTETRIANDVAARNGGGPGQNGGHVGDLASPGGWVTPVMSQPVPGLLGTPNPATYAQPRWYNYGRSGIPMMNPPRPGGMSFEDLIAANRWNAAHMGGQHDPGNTSFPFEGSIYNDPGLVGDGLGNNYYGGLL